MRKLWTTLTLLCAVLAVQVGQSYAGHKIPDPNPAQPVNPVVQWNKTCS